MLILSFLGSVKSVWKRARPCRYLLLIPLIVTFMLVAYISSAKVLLPVKSWTSEMTVRNVSMFRGLYDWCCVTVSLSLTQDMLFDVAFFVCTHFSISVFHLKLILECGPLEKKKKMPVHVNLLCLHRSHPLTLQHHTTLERTLISTSLFWMNPVNVKRKAHSWFL